MLEGTCLCGRARWRFHGEPQSATACNCTACRRSGALWIYGHEGEDVEISGETATYARERGKPSLDFHFCPTCGSTLAWRGRHLEDGRRRMAVNVRLTEPERVAHLPIDHFDGFDTFEDLPRDGRTVKDMWA